MVSSHLKASFSVSLGMFQIIQYPCFRRAIVPNKTIPITISTEPLIDQAGLLYINEVDGPINELDCAVKIRPNNTKSAPITIIQFFNIIEKL
jgi:hypothetical protein